MKVRSLILAALLFAAPIFSAPKPKQTPEQAQIAFHQDLEKSTLALYERYPTPLPSLLDELFPDELASPDGFTARFICTVTVIGKQDDTYALLSAGHCFQDSGANLKYYVSEGISTDPTLQRVKVLKVASTKKYDYAILELQSEHDYPVIKISVGDAPPVETPLVSVNYSLGLTKQLVKGYVGSEVMQREETSKLCHLCAGRFIAEIGMGPGASGSAVINDTTHEVVGIVEGGFSAWNIGAIVMPMGKSFDNFMIDDAVMDKLPPAPPVKKIAATPVKTPAKSNPFKTDIAITAVWILLLLFIMGITAYELKRP